MQTIITDYKVVLNANRPGKNRKQPSKRKRAALSLDFDASHLAALGLYEERPMLVFDSTCTAPYDMTWS